MFPPLLPSRWIAFLGDYLPRKCGIATFTSDFLTGVAAEYPRCECFAVPVNAIKGGYEYPDVVRFEIEDQDLASYRRAADFLNIGNVDIVCVQHEFGICGGPAGRVLQELIARSTRLAVIERFIRSMKNECARTPDEIYFGSLPACRRPRFEPRSRWAEALAPHLPQMSRVDPRPFWRRSTGGVGDVCS